MDSTSLVVIAVIATPVVLYFLGKYAEKRKLFPIIDAGLKSGLSRKAVALLLARDATRSLGRALTSQEVTKIGLIVNDRVAGLKLNSAQQKETDTEDVFKYLNRDVSPFLLQQDEKVVLTLPCIGLREPRSVRVSHGVYGGPSFRIARGVYVRTGGFRSSSQSHEELKDIDGGDLMVSNKRLIFIGKQRTINVPFKKVVSLEAFPNSLVLHKDGKERAQHFVWPMNLLSFNGNTITGPVLQQLITSLRR